MLEINLQDSTVPQVKTNKNIYWYALWSVHNCWTTFC